MQAPVTTVISLSLTLKYFLTSGATINLKGRPYTMGVTVTYLNVWYKVKTKDKLLCNKFWLTLYGPIHFRTQI
jgi:hypothetical protein